MVLVAGSNTGLGEFQDQGIVWSRCVSSLLNAIQIRDKPTPFFALAARFIRCVRHADTLTFAEGGCDFPDGCKEPGCQSRKRSGTKGSGFKTGRTDGNTVREIGMELDKVIVCRRTTIHAELSDAFLHCGAHRIHEVSILESDGI
jgi:hypothetical protein